MTTSDDIRYQVTQAIAGTDDVDIDGIVSEIVATYGLVGIDSINDIEFWAIVGKHDSTQGTSYTETFDVGIDGTELLALPLALDRRVADAVHGDDLDRGDAIRQEINAAITEKIQQHGVDLQTGEWFGDWSTEEIVTDILRRHNA